RVVAQTRDLSAALLFDSERLEHVVHFRRLEIEPGGFAGSELSRALEIPDSVLVEHNLPDRQVRGECRRGESRGHESGNSSHHISELDTTGDGASHFE